MTTASYDPRAKVGWLDIKNKSGKVVDRKPYMSAYNSLVWFRKTYPAPRSRIVTTIVNLESRIIRAEIYIDGEMVATSHVKGDGSKSLEKLEIGAIRRALGYAGFGTDSAMAWEIEGGAPADDEDGDPDDDDLDETDE